MGDLYYGDFLSSEVHFVLHCQNRTEHTFIISQVKYMTYELYNNKKKKKKMPKGKKKKRKERNKKTKQKKKNSKKYVLILIKVY